MGKIWIPIWDNKRYPLKIIIRKPVQGGGMTLQFDRAGKRKMKNQGHVIEFWKFKYSGHKIKRTSLDKLIHTKKGTFLDLFSPEDGDYYPTRFDPQNGKLEVINEDQKQWFISKMMWRERIFRPPESMWARYYPVILVVMLGVAFMLMFIGYGQFMKEAGQPLYAAAANLRAAADTLGGVVGQF